MNKRQFKKITICLDMHGCPNRCKHCWLGHSPNPDMTADDLRFAANEFRGYTSSLEVYDWYREPDFADDYRETRKLAADLSDSAPAQFELISFWRAVRDADYIPWLKSNGVKVCQLTLFGGESQTDFHVGRKGAYAEILSTMDYLLSFNIAPRLQIFVNRLNMHDLSAIVGVLSDLDLERRCAAIGIPFEAFMHQGSCDGANESMYDVRITDDDLDNIPDVLQRYTLHYFHKDRLADIFGKAESCWCNEFLNDNSTRSLAGDVPVFLIDGNWNVFPNITAPSQFWNLGNLKKDGIESILATYAENRSVAQAIQKAVPLREMAASCGRATSARLFTRNDYIIFLLNQYCRSFNHQPPAAQ